MAIFGLIAIGFANSIMWGAIWPLAIVDLGRFTKTGSSLLVMGIVGGAIIPLIFNGLNSSVFPHIIFLGTFLWIAIFVAAFLSRLY